MGHEGGRGALGEVPPGRLDPTHQVLPLVRQQLSPIGVVAGSWRFSSPPPLPACPVVLSSSINGGVGQAGEQLGVGLLELGLDRHEAFLERGEVRLGRLARGQGSLGDRPAAPPCTPP